MVARQDIQLHLVIPRKCHQKLHLHNILYCQFITHTGICGQFHNFCGKLCVKCTGLREKLIYYCTGLLWIARTTPTARILWFFAE